MTKHIFIYKKVLNKANKNSFVQDNESDLRNNGVYGLGELVLFGGDLIVPNYNQILSNISNLLNIETEPRVIDQIVGAVSRCFV